MCLGSAASVWGCWEGVKVGVKNTDLSELGFILSDSLSVKDQRAVTVAGASVLRNSLGSSVSFDLREVGFSHSLGTPE